MQLLDQILAQLIRDLTRDGMLALQPDASEEEVASELRHRFSEAAPFTQAGPAISQALIQSDLVDDLYATDQEIIEALNRVSVGTTDPPGP